MAPIGELYLFKEKQIGEQKMNKKPMKNKRLEFEITKDASKRFEEIRDKLSKKKERKITKSSLARMAIHLGLNSIQNELQKKDISNEIL